MSPFMLFCLRSRTSADKMHKYYQVDRNSCWEISVSKFQFLFPSPLFNWSIILQISQGDELGIERSDVRNVKLAGIECGQTSDMFRWGN